MSKARRKIDALSFSKMPYKVTVFDVEAMGEMRPHRPHIHTPIDVRYSKSDKNV